MKKRHLFLSLLLVMGCSDKKSEEEEIQDLDHIVQELRRDINLPEELTPETIQR